MRLRLPLTPAQAAGSTIYEGNNGTHTARRRYWSPICWRALAVTCPCLDLGHRTVKCITCQGALFGPNPRSVKTPQGGLPRRGTCGAKGRRQRIRRPFLLVHAGRRIREREGPTARATTVVRFTPPQSGHRATGLVCPLCANCCREQMQQMTCAVGHYSITSAVICMIRGTVRPRAFAVLRLISNSNVVGCMTGRSAGLLPLRMRPA